MATQPLTRVVAWRGWPAAGTVAKRFLAKALRRSRDWTPRVINTDKNPAYGEAIAELKKEGLLPEDTQQTPTGEVPQQPTGR